MILELAPMEAITTYIYRNALHRYFPGIDVFFSPFISLQNKKTLNYKELMDINPSNNEGMKLIPQLMTNNAEDFLFIESQIMNIGYSEVNLNFGCPSGTVTTKYKGAGIFQNLNQLDEILDKIYSSTRLKVSIKTRVGYENDDEWEKIISIYKKYPIYELIFHPRVRQDFYNGYPRRELLHNIKDMPQTKLSYNGNIYSKDDYDIILSENTDISAVMIGRGVITNPALAAEIKGTKYSNEEFKKIFREFHDEILARYIEIMPGEKPTLFKMKELWSYMMNLSENSEKDIKKIRKANTINEYRAAINEIMPKICLESYVPNIGLC